MHDAENDHNGTMANAIAKTSRPMLHSVVRLWKDENQLLVVVDLGLPCEMRASPAEPFIEGEMSCVRDGLR